MHERVPDQHARHTAVLLGEAEQHAHDRLELPRAALLLARDFVDKREKRLLYEFDQAFEHLRFAGEVAIERRFRYFQLLGKRSRRYLFRRGPLEHPRKRLQNLALSFARSGHRSLPPYASRRSARRSPVRFDTFTSTYAGERCSRETQTVVIPRFFAVRRLASVSSTMIQRCGRKWLARTRRRNPCVSGFG